MKEIHDKGMYYVPIVDAGTAYRPHSNYTLFEAAEANGAFIKGADGKTLIGSVWPNEAAFVDWSSEHAGEFWQAGLDHLNSQLPFDGLWLDMNEASNFCRGVCYDEQREASPVKYKLPYVPTGRDLEEGSLSLDGKHANGYTELDMHSTYSFHEIKASHEWFQAKKKRTMIISRSSQSGVGKYGSRWLGDNFSLELFMGYSVTGIITSSMYGMPLAGVDICGFTFDTTPELCARWTVLGTFYPFSRNHNAYGWIPQEPYQ